MRIYATRWFGRFMRRSSIEFGDLGEAVERAERGLVDANLGGGVIKQRLARAGEGRSGGYRVVLYYRMRHRAVFAFGFAKKDMSNFDAADLVRLRAAAALVLALTDDDIAALVRDGKLLEVPR